MIRALLLTFLLLSPSLFAQEKIEEEFYTVLLKGAPVGSLRQATWKTEQGTYHSQLEQTTRLSRFGVPFTISRSDLWIEDGRFTLVGLTAETDLNGQLQTVRVRSREGELEVVLRIGEKTQTIRLGAAQPVTGLYGATRLVGQAVARGEAGGEVSYSFFSPETLKIEQVRIRILGPGEEKDSLGRTQRGIVVEERSTALPEVVTTSVYSESGRLLYSRTPLGATVELVRAPAGAAEIESAPPFNVISLGLGVRGYERLPAPPARLRSVTVRFTGQALPLLEEAVRTSWQDLGAGRQSDVAVRSYVESGQGGGKGSLVVELRREAILSSWRAAEPGGIGAEPGEAGAEPSEAGAEPGGIGAERREAAEYLGGGLYLSLDDPRLAALAQGCPGGAAGPARPARTALPNGQPLDAALLACLEKRVHEFIENKSLAHGFAGVDEILDSRAGDCSEHALLLVALLRRLEVPSRLAYGLILTEAGFIGHAWSEAFLDGRWYWLDPSFPGAEPYGFKLRLGLLDPAEPDWIQMGWTLLRVGSEAQAEILAGSLRADGARQ